MHLIPEEPCAAMTFTNERNISLFAPPPHNHRTMISSLERKAEVSVYWPPNLAIICQALQYRVQMTAMPTLKECNHSTPLITVFGEVLLQGIWQWVMDNFGFKRNCYNFCCSSAKPCASTASCMTGQWQEVRMGGGRLAQSSP